MGTDLRLGNRAGGRRPRVLWAFWHLPCGRSRGLLGDGASVRLPQPRRCTPGGCAGSWRRREAQISGPREQLPGRRGLCSTGPWVSPPVPDEEGATCRAPWGPPGSVPRPRPPSRWKGSPTGGRAAPGRTSSLLFPGSLSSLGCLQSAPGFLTSGSGSPRLTQLCPVSWKQGDGGDW